LEKRKDIKMAKGKLETTITNMETRALDKEGR
jgi:hypothetical protein